MKSIEHTVEPGAADGSERSHRREGSRATVCRTDHETRIAAAELLALHFRVLSEPMRIRILQLLQNGEQSVSRIAAELGTTQPNVSRHVHILRDSGVISLRQEKTTVFCAIRDPLAIAVCDRVCRSLGAQLNGQTKLAKKLKP